MKKTIKATTAGSVGKKVGTARKRLPAALESGKKLLGQVEAKAGKGAKLTNKAVRAHPYRAIAVAVGVGAIIREVAGRIGTRPRR